MGVEIENGDTTPSATIDAVVGMSIYCVCGALFTSVFN